MLDQQVDGPDQDDRQLCPVYVYVVDRIHHINDCRPTTGAG